MASSSRRRSAQEIRIFNEYCQAWLRLHVCHMPEEADSITEGFAKLLDMSAEDLESSLPTEGTFWQLLIKKAENQSRSENVQAVVNGVSRVGATLYSFGRTKEGDKCGKWVQWLQRVVVELKLFEYEEDENFELEKTKLFEREVQEYLQSKADAEE